MSTTNPEPNITNGETPSSVPPTPVADIPTTGSTPSSNGGQTTEEIKNSNNANPVSADPPVVQAKNAINSARSSAFMRQFFPGGSNSDWMKREKLDLDALEKDARNTGTYAGALIVTAAVVPVVAAVGGVLLTQKLTSLVDIFDPKNILSGLIVVAVFGLTPSLLIGTLQKQTEQYKTDLKSTAATQGESVKTP